MFDDETLSNLFAKLVEKHGEPSTRIRLGSYMQLELDPRVDGLTGCLSRRAFDEDLPKWINEAARQETRFKRDFLCCDIDNFQRVVEREGLTPSDELLSALSERLKASCESVYRFAGDQFVAPNCTTLIDDSDLGIRLRQCVVSVDLGIEKARRARAVSWVAFHLHHGMVQPNFDGGTITCTEPPEWSST